MGSEASEQMMALLGELAALKELKRENEADSSQPEQDSHRLEERHAAITQDIKELAEQKKDGEPPSPPQK
jgi:hypothetical protein